MFILEFKVSPRLISTAAILVLVAGPVYAQATSIQFTLNTFFIAICSILIMWMAAGFTMLEAGLVRTQSVINQCAKNLGLFSVASIAFLIVGYGFMFPTDSWIVPGILGTPSVTDIGPVATDANSFSIDDLAKPVAVFFQMMVCATVVSIVSGALAERIKLVPFFIFCAIFTGVIYPIQASWTWGGGFLDTTFGFKDLAGSTVIHVVGGVAALTGSIILGARQGRFVDGKKIPVLSHSIPLATLGALILWMGWFGFNAGAFGTLSSKVDAINISRILLNTNMAAAGGVLVAAGISYFKYNRFDILFMINGALAGLVSITADPLHPDPALALVIGGIAGLLVFWATMLIDAFKIDDVVGAVPAHLVSGIWGTLVVALSHPGATIFGQGVSILIVIVFTAVTTSFIWLALKMTIGIRVAADSENQGVDNAELVIGM